MTERLSSIMAVVRVLTKSVYFGSTGNITLEYLDDTGTPYYYVYGESHVGYTIANYSSLPAGYYTITIHSIYGYTYTGNFTVS